MKKHQPFLFVLVLSALSLLLACEESNTAASTTQNQEPSSYEGVSPAKADNYYSNIAAEYELSTVLVVDAPADLIKDIELNADTLKEYAQKRITAFGLYLTTYLTDKFRGIDSNGNGSIEESEVFFHNDGYGGFHAMVRNYSAALNKLSVNENGELLVSFSFDVAGPKNMLVDLPGTWDEGQVNKQFELQMPKGVTSSPEFIDRKVVRNFDPKTYQGELETVLVNAKAHPVISNAYPQYQSFFEDGIYDITLFYGHDYNTERSDIREAKEAFYELQYMGFELPVEKFEDLKHDSGIFAKQIQVGGKEVKIEVRIFHSNMFTEDRKLQHDLAISETVSRDVFFYNGHAGPYYGFYLDADSLAKVDYKEFATAPFTEKQQLFIAQGCQTYSQYADMLYANPAKSEANLDVITTVNYSYGQGTIPLLRALLGKNSRYDANEGFTANDYYQMIEVLNDEWINEVKGVYYGIMGIDGNPQLYPFVDVNLVGKACESNQECGDKNAYKCVAVEEQKQCAAVTLSPSACPENTEFMQLASGNTILAGSCVRISNTGLIYGLDPNSADAQKIIDWLNTANENDLLALGFSAQLVKNILEFKLGLDGLVQTEDDAIFASLSQINAITGMDEASFKRLFNIL